MHFVRRSLDAPRPTLWPGVRNQDPCRQNASRRRKSAVERLEASASLDRRVGAQNTVGVAVVNAWERDSRPLVRMGLLLAVLGRLRVLVSAMLLCSSDWNEIVNFDALVRHGMIRREDLALFRFAADPATAPGPLQARIAATWRSRCQPPRTRRDRRPDAMDSAFHRSSMSHPPSA